MILSTYLYTYLLTSLLSCSQTDNLPCIHMHPYVMIPVIWSGTILLVAFIITTTSYCYDQDGETAMIGAAGNGYKDIVEYLVSQGADKDIKNNVSTPLVHLHLYKMKYMYMYVFIYVWMYIYIYVNILRYLHSFLYLYSYIYA